MTRWKGGGEGGEATVAKIIRNFGAIGSKRVSKGRTTTAREREKRWIISVLARQNIAVDPLRNWRHTGVYGATTNRAASITYTVAHTSCTHEVVGRGASRGVSNATLDRIGALALTALIYRRFPRRPCIFMRVQTFLHGRRNKHGKRDTAGHAVLRQHRKTETPGGAAASNSRHRGCSLCEG